MPLSVAPTQSDVFTTLRSFLLGLSLNYSPPQTVFVVLQGQMNRVPEPAGADFVVMWPISRERIETNVDTYATGSATTNEYLQPTKITIQMDVHGPNASDNAEIISTMFRDQYAVDAFAETNSNIFPLLADDPKQVPFINAASQFETRWIVEAQIQANQVVSGVPQQSADVVDVTLINVDEAFPPTPLPPIPVPLWVQYAGAPIGGCSGIGQT